LVSESELEMSHHDSWILGVFINKIMTGKALLETALFLSFFLFFYLFFFFLLAGS